MDSESLLPGFLKKPTNTTYFNLRKDSTVYNDYTGAKIEVGI